MKKTVLTIMIIFLVLVAGCRKNPGELSETEKQRLYDALLRQEKLDEPQNYEEPADSRIGKTANDFQLTDLSGKQVKLSDFKGKKVVLNFWASWCPPCREEMPEIQRLYDGGEKNGYKVLIVNVGEDRKTVEKFLKDNNYNMNSLLDQSQDVSNNYQVFNIPTTFFIDKEGKIQNVRVGVVKPQDIDKFFKM